MKTAVGVCLGASSISFTKIQKNDKGQVVIKDVLTLLHNGNPKEVFIDKLMQFNPEKHPVVVTGRKFRKLVKLTNISEPEATEYAFRYLYKSRDNYTAIASLGGETFIAYPLDEEGRIASVITKNQCASGTGEFFLQQIKRMNLGIDEVLSIAKDADPYKVSGRCSVFCKSDCTHALNKGTPQSEVASGLALMMADKVEELLKKLHGGKMLVVGGVTRNDVVMDFLRKKLDNIEIPKEATYFEALGAALYAMDNEINEFKSFDDVFDLKESSFVFHQPLKKFEDKVQFKTMERGKAKEGDICVLGLDVGSTTTKAVVIRKSDNKILGSVYLYTHGNPVAAAKKCYAELLNQIPEKIHIIGVGTTGSGRQIAGLHALTDGVINEIVAHATAAVYFDEEVDTIFEIGGQDAKYTYIVNKVPADYAMNEACSAGTGSFIEEAAFESLGIPVTGIEPIAMRGMNPPNFSDQCAAFISSDIKTALHENIGRDDVVAGLVYSICLNYVNRVKGNRPVGKKIFMQGGVCYNKAIPIAMAALTGTEIIVPPEPGLMGAFGVALEVKDKIDLGLMKPGEFSLKELAEREVKYKNPFTCAGGKEKCDLRCTINMIEVQGKKYPFGGACNKYYNLLLSKPVDSENYDYIKRRHELMFKKYSPVTDLPENAPTIGINASYNTFTIYPLFYNFFTKLGFRVVLSDKVEEEGLEREMTSFCYPGQLSLGLFQDLVNKNPDYYFVPSILEMHVNEEDHYRIDFNSSCVFVITEPYTIRQAFKDIDFGDRLLMPCFNFAAGFDAQFDKFVETANSMGVTDKKKIREAHDYAVKMLDKYQDEMFAMGDEFLKELEKNPEDMAIVLVGRPYNSFTEHANKGIPQKFASRGVYIVPFDMFDYRNETVEVDMYWEGGKKILKVAKIIKRHPQLFATYISNFSCGPDSLLITTFRGIMGTKPSLTLELDGHTADAGVNTRIDAALDIIKNYRKLSQNIGDPDYSNFRLAEVVFNSDGGFFVTSDGEKVPITDKRVKVLIPSMGDLSAAFFAAGLRSQGYNAEALPEGNPDILKYGRSVATGKECLPLLLTAGSFLDYIENKWDGKEYLAMFMAQGAGNCRLGQYPVFLKEMIKRKRLKNVTLFVLFNDDGFTGAGPKFATRGIQTLLAADVMDDIRSGIMAHAEDPEKGLEIFYEEYSRLMRAYEYQPDDFYKDLETFAKNINKRIPAAVPIEEAKYVVLCGEIYVRRDHFSHKWLNKYFAKKGFILKDAYITEWLFYVDYLIKIGLLEPESSLKGRIERKIRETFVHHAEGKIKKILAKTGYYEFMRTEIKPLLEYSKHIIPMEYKGEPGLTLGAGLHEALDRYAGVINLGPFGCMPTRFAEAAAAPEMKVESKRLAMDLNSSKHPLSEIFNGKMNIPFLTIESDGNPFPQVIEARLETFTLQVERAAKLMKLAKTHKKGEPIKKEVHEVTAEIVHDEGLNGKTPKTNGKTNGKQVEEFDFSRSSK